MSEMQYRFDRRYGHGNQLQRPSHGSHDAETVWGVIKTINRATEDKNLPFVSFVYYVSENHPSVLGFTPPDPLREQIRQLLASVSLPAVELHPGIRSRLPADSPEPSTAKKWWEFWKRGP